MILNRKNIIGLGMLVAAMSSNIVKAGNPERQGQAGAAQLTINSWGRSSGLGYAYGGMTKGAEAMYLNVAGMSRGINTTELSFYRSEWLRGSGIGVNTVGFAQKINGGEGGTFGISVMQFGIKPIETTTEQNPYGGIGTYRVNMTNIGLAYSKTFSNAISAGLVVRGVSEGIPDAQASGVTLDAGVQYITTLKPGNKAKKKDDFKFGISIKNIGPGMKHQGEGLSYKAILDNGDFAKTVQVKAESIKMPSFLNIAASYDMKLDSDPNQYDNKLTAAFSFTNFAFSANQATFGLEYSYKEILSVRAGFAYQEGIFSLDTRTSAFTGLQGGVSYNFNAGDDSEFSVDYSYRATNPFSGVHTFGVRLGLGK